MKVIVHTFDRGYGSVSSLLSLFQSSSVYTEPFFGGDIARIPITAASIKRTSVSDGMQQFKTDLGVTALCQSSQRKHCSRRVHLKSIVIPARR